MKGGEIMFKRVMMLVLCFCMAIGGSISSFAMETNVEINSEEVELITPYMNYIASGYLGLAKAGSNKVEIDCSIIGYQGIATKIKITANLQENRNGVWHTISTYTTTSNSHRGSLVREVVVSTGKTYRVTALIQAYNGSLSEVIIMRSNEVKM